MSIEPEGRELDFKPLSDLTETIQRLIRTRLWVQILIGMVFGIGVGILLSPDGGALVSQSSADVIAGWLALPGQVFLALIQMVVLPLVVASIVLGVASSGDPVQLRKMGGRVGLYFLVTTAAATAIGIALALFVQPGNYLDRETVQQTLGPALVVASAPAEEVRLADLPDRIVALIPSDPARAALNQSMLQVVLFAILMGIALLAIPPARAKPLLDLSGSLQEVSMQVVSWAMLLAPYAVFGLLAQISIKIGLEALLGLSIYVVVVLGGLVILNVLYLIVVAIGAGMSPVRFLSATREVQLLAFSTSSSAAVMPLSIRTVQDKLGVRPSIAQFVIPVGATVNMAGTALYQVVAAIFLTQVFGVETTLGDLLLLSATTVGASIGSPSSPGAGIVILATILQSMGIPPGGVALLLGVDRILDMSRTTVNVVGDLVACVLMNRWIGRG
ncbi:MAG: dicarboxylate/amino acid:cation symporter [Acidobacteria bacterium]|nr:dicarboxylate/amino acid:cation symporter [Acidobacteriota bacterium]